MQELVGLPLQALAMPTGRDSVVRG
jgi:hypothetical protein